MTLSLILPLLSILRIATNGSGTNFGLEHVKATLFSAILKVNIYCENN